MNAERRRLVESLFEEALEVAPAAREAWLAGATGDDPAVADDVRVLLDAHDRAEGILEGDAVGSARAVLDNPLRGRRLGSYRVVRELGRGGMGVVYLAERDDGQFRRQVAVKLLRASPDADELLRRFASERQILASLNHANIAQLLDGGVSEGQVPYLVMEYVDGQPITDYADQQGLDLDGRLRLFQDVCAAVHHAHQNLVIHRDLKPGNVLVTARGEVKLLDFGIAKLLNPSLGAIDAPVTRTELRVMTPEYASPEQVRGVPLSTASDVYSLGVVLYELLCGRRPYRLATASPQEMSRLVLEREPDRPSERVSEVEPVHDPVTARPVRSPDTIAAARALSPERLRRTLRGDLDAIVLMALRKEPGRRYGSADLLSQDIQRYLDGLPVLAHRGSRAYRVRRFVERHRAAVAAAAIVLASVVGGAGVALRLAAVADAERDRAELARQQAESALQRSEAVTNFLARLFESAGPDVSPGDTLMARQLIRRGMLQVAELSGQPLVQAEMLDAIARLHRGFAQYTDAQRVLERSLALRDSAGEPPGEGAVTRQLLAETLRRRGDYDESERLVRGWLARLEATGGPASPGIPELLIELGATLVYRNALAEAESLAVRALELRRQESPVRDSLVARALEHLASLQRRRANVAAAEAALREAVAVRRRSYGPDDLFATMPVQRLADIQWEEYENYAAAESLYRDAYEIQRRVLGDAHPWVAASAASIALIIEQRGDNAEAERAHRVALDIVTRAYGSQHPTTAGMMAGLSRVVWRAGRRQEGIEINRRALAVYRRAFGESHAAYANALVDLGELLSLSGVHAEADTLSPLGLAIRRNAVGDRNPGAGMALAVYGRHLTRRGRYAAADSVFGAALESMRPEVPDSHKDVKRIYQQMAENYRAWGKLEEAERFARLAAGS